MAHEPDAEEYLKIERPLEEDEPDIRDFMRFPYGDLLNPIHRTIDKFEE